MTRATQRASKAPALVFDGDLPPTMSSQEIAKLTGKEHRNVLRDIRKMLAELHGEGGVLRFEGKVVNPQNGQHYPIFNLPQRETFVLIAGYSVTLRAAIVRRWLELEERNAAAVAAPPISYAEALQRAADQEERRQRAAQALPDCSER